jgi:hypothetical protein
MSTTALISWPVWYDGWSNFAVTDSQGSSWPWRWVVTYQEAQVKDG